MDWINLSSGLRWGGGAVVRLRQDPTLTAARPDGLCRGPAAAAKPVRRGAWHHFIIEWTQEAAGQRQQRPTHRWSAIEMK